MQTKFGNREQDPAGLDEIQFSLTPAVHYPALRAG